MTVEFSASPSEALGIGLRVLVVEDEPAVRHLLDRLLTRRGHHVITAPSAVEAAAMILDYGVAIDIALVDVALPGISGLEFAGGLHRDFPSARIVMMTGWLDNDQLAVAQARGPVLLKPFRPEALFTIVESTP